MEKRYARLFPIRLGVASNKPPYNIAKTHLGKLEARMLPCIAREDASFNRKYSYIESELEHLIGDGEDADPGKPRSNKTEKDVTRCIIMRSLV